MKIRFLLIIFICFTFSLSAQNEKYQTTAVGITNKDGKHTKWGKSKVVIHWNINDLTVKINTDPPRIYKIFTKPETIEFENVTTTYYDSKDNKGKNALVALSKYLDQSLEISITYDDFMVTYKLVKK